MLARIGGEEFSVLLLDTSLAEVKVIGEKIRHKQSHLLITRQWQVKLK